MILLLLAASLLQSTPTDTRAQKAGAKLFERECSACHGSDLSGRRKAPPLDRPDIRAAKPSQLFLVLKNGRLSKGMPSFAHLPPEQRWQIIAFLQNYQRR